MDVAADNFPRKKAGLEIGDAADGFVIHDKNRDRIHYLNRTAVLILELCDGAVSPDTIATLLQTAYDLPEPPHDLVQSCLKRLAEECLID